MPLLASASAVSLSRISEWPGIHCNDTEIDEEQRDEREDQTECKEADNKGVGDEERTDRAERESDRRRREVK